MTDNRDAHTEQIAETIWNASRADEGTISATGAKIVAKTLLPVVADAEQTGAAQVVAAVEAALSHCQHIDPCNGDGCLRPESPEKIRMVVRAALSAGRTALDTQLAQARAEALREAAREAEERGDIGKDGGLEAWDWLRGINRRHELASGEGQ